MVNIELPDGSILEISKGKTVLDVAKQIGPRLAEAALAGKVDGNLVDLHYAINSDVKLEILTEKSEESLHVLNHSAAHVMAGAVVDLFPNAKPTIGPSIDPVGFYYDFFVENPFTQEDIDKIQKRVEEVIQENSEFDREEMSLADAIKYYEKVDKNKFKVEILKETETDNVSFYSHGEGNFKDLCRGPHVPYTGKIKAIKILSASSAFWRADPNKESLQRVYGVAFSTEKQLKKHLAMLEEAKKRDHRIIGPQLDLFDTADEWGPGMPLIYPKGAIILDVLKDFWKKEHRKAGYELVQTPHVFKEIVWQTSGHTEYFIENMFPVDLKGEKWYIKPMNCPGHMMIYNRRAYSYRELPVRIGEMGTVYRNELSGTLHGLFRIRSFTQDDAHIFMLPDQLEDEIVKVIEIVEHFYKTFGFQEWEYFISTRPDKAIGTDEGWEHATKALMKALERANLTYKIKEGEGVFYGPKIDVDVKDALGRKWQLSTIQVDFNLPDRFNINYLGEDGQKHTPYVIHRVIYGAIERFLAILVENYSGKMPIWLSPVQVIVIPITDQHVDYAKQVVEDLLKDDIRAEADLSGERMEYKIRQATLKKIPFILNVGDKESEAKTIAVRSRGNKVEFGVKILEFIEKVRKLIEAYE
ncbi:MAG: threonine--tRNA ligase [Candidatus Heimdallarchaeota archaeon]|nr:threonine--tRNA ligase [Candidatus Heimdallarchaeota archaeon]MCG3257475.1 threonine--tRNA ligase [Candidatus Heimdallarchaeota archaeon]MCK4612528.1 threonine--tRNA ligase [Candidatus Heimdallarchaeota archaeon]